MGTKVKVREILDKFERTYPEGFTNVEVELIILKNFPNINRKKFNDAVFGNTSPMINGQLLYYPWDIETALICGIEERDQNQIEWD